MITSLFSTSIFGFLTMTYFISKFYFVDRHKESKGLLSKLLPVVYIILIIISQLIINIQNTKEICNGVPQIISAVMYTVVPNFFILGSLMLLLMILPGWKAPFSNTIGYFFVYMLGVNNAFTDLLKSKGSKLIDKICNNKSIIINEITPFNFDMFLNKMKTDGLLENNFKSKPAFNELWNYVVIKDSISEFVWVCLTGALVISMTYNALLEINCNIPIAQRKAAANKLEAEIADEEANKPKEKLFTIHD